MNLTFYPGQYANQLTSDLSDEDRVTFLQTLSRPDVGFFRLEDAFTGLDGSLEIYRHFQNKKTFVHVGIGGSSLGPQMLVKALKKSEVNFLFLDNIDPDHLYELLSQIPKVEDALFFMVSKSGTTAETAALQTAIKNFFSGKKLEFVFCTDPTQGDLRKLAHDESIPCLDLPRNIGGRFSVLTPVGFLPALFAGLNLEKLLAGALKNNEEIFDEDFFRLGSFLAGLERTGVNQTVFMPYSSKLKSFSHWFVQLWAESLGKNRRGLTPLSAVGATDQHSIMQLFMDGPRDKAYLLLSLKKFSHDFSLKNGLSERSFSALSLYSLSDLMRAELLGTLKAMAEKKLPLIHLELESLNEETLGGLIVFTETLTVLVAQLLGVDPFNQPGVEAGKVYAYQELQKL